MAATAAMMILAICMITKFVVLLPCRAELQFLSELDAVIREYLDPLKFVAGMPTELRQVSYTCDIIFLAPALSCSKAAFGRRLHCVHSCYLFIWDRDLSGYVYVTLHTVGLLQLCKLDSYGERLH